MIYDNRITLKEAVKFHGHLGPWLVLGILIGEFALKKLKARKYFGLKVKVWGANKKPKSCLIDGLQLSTGATYGKGNISKFNGPAIKIEFFNCASNRKFILKFKDKIVQELNKADTHRLAENLAKKIYRINPENLFIWK